MNFGLAKPKANLLAKLGSEDNLQTKNNYQPEENDSSSMTTTSDEDAQFSE